MVLIMRSDTRGRKHLPDRFLNSGANDLLPFSRPGSSDIARLLHNERKLLICGLNGGIEDVEYRFSAHGFSFKDPLILQP